MVKIITISCLFFFTISNSIANATIPSGLEWPLPGLPDQYRISSSFGDHWQNSYCSGKRQLHTGLDLTNNNMGNTTVYAIWSGKTEAVVTYAKSYNNFVTISHGTSSNPWTATYHHIYPTVVSGQNVTKGQKIGTVVTANPNGAHLHIGIRDKAYSNTANRGRLPETSACGGDPYFPNYFVDPANLDWHWRW